MYREEEAILGSEYGTAKRSRKCFLSYPGLPLIWNFHKKLYF